MEILPLENRRLRKLYLAARTNLFFLLLLAVLASRLPVARAQGQADAALSSPPPSIWKTGLGEGFKKGAQELTLSGGPGFGMPILGSKHDHDWVLGTLDYGWMLSDVVGQDRWYRGNWEIIAEVFGGRQYRPDSAYLVGGAPLLRYNFALGHRVMPFFNAGAGLTATDIRNEDLSTTFEFNLQVGVGARIFFRDNVAAVVQYRFIHLSNAHLAKPNLGVNNSTVLVGLSWFF